MLVTFKTHYFSINCHYWQKSALVILQLHIWTQIFWVGRVTIPKQTCMPPFRMVGTQEIKTFSCVSEDLRYCTVNKYPFTGMCGISQTQVQASGLWKLWLQRGNLIFCQIYSLNLLLKLELWWVMQGHLSPKSQPAAVGRCLPDWYYIRKRSPLNTAKGDPRTK